MGGLCCAIDSSGQASRTSDGISIWNRWRSLTADADRGYPSGDNRRKARGSDRGERGISLAPVSCPPGRRDVDPV